MEKKCFGNKIFLSGNYRVDLKTQQIQYFMIFYLVYIILSWLRCILPIWNEPDGMVNILSVLIYFCVILVQKKKYDMAYYLCFGEVVGYYVAATYIFGLGYGFNLYLIGLLAASYFASYIFLRRKSRLRSFAFWQLYLLHFLYLCWYQVFMIRSLEQTETFLMNWSTGLILSPVPVHWFFFSYFYVKDQCVRESSEKPEHRV